MDIDMGTSRLRSPTPIHGSGVTGGRPVTELKIRFSVNGGLCSSVRGGGALRTKQVPVNCSASKTTSCRFSRLPGQLPFMWMSESTKQPQLLLPRWCLSTVGVQFPTRTTSVLCTRSD